MKNKAEEQDTVARWIAPSQRQRGGNMHENIPKHIHEIPDGMVSGFYPSVIDSMIMGYRKIGFKNTGEIVMLGNDGKLIAATFPREKAEEYFQDALAGRCNFVWSEICKKTFESRIAVSPFRRCGG